MSNKEFSYKEKLKTLSQEQLIDELLKKANASEKEKARQLSEPSKSKAERLNKFCPISGRECKRLDLPSSFACQFYCPGVGCRIDFLIGKLIMIADDILSPLVTLTVEDKNDE